MTNKIKINEYYKNKEPQSLITTLTFCYNTAFKLLPFSSLALINSLVKYLF